MSIFMREKTQVSGKPGRLLVVYELLEGSPVELDENIAAIQSAWGNNVDVFKFAVQMRFPGSKFLRSRDRLFKILRSKAKDYDYFLITRIWQKSIPTRWVKELTNHILATQTHYVSIDDLEFGGSDHLRLELISSKGINELARERIKFLPQGRLNASGHVSSIPMMPSVDLVNEYFATHMDELYKYPRVINIENCTSCNMACQMCTFHGEKAVPWNKKPVILPMDVYTKLLEEAATFTPKPTLEFCHRGEELLDPKIIEKTKLAKDMGFGLILITNGLLLTEKTALALLETGIDNILISCESVDPENYAHLMRGKADFSVLVNNIRNLLRLRGDKYKTSVGIKTVFLEENILETNQIRQFWFDFGVDYVSFQNEYYNDNGMFRARHQPFTINFRRACRNLFLSMVVNVDGTVQSCSVPDPDDETVRFGKFPDQSLLEIWRGEALSHYRKAAVEGRPEEIPHCGKCSGEMCTSTLLEKTIEGNTIRSLSPSVLYFEKLKSA